MFHPRPCGCKGQRSCLVCEGAAPGAAGWITPTDKEGAYVYCPECALAWPGWDTDSWRCHPDHQGEPIVFPGVKIIQNFISEEEERTLLSCLEEVPWDLSQSGRRKQNYGPKCNFKKRRVRCDAFSGYPAFTQYLQERFALVDVMQGFQTVEQCSLEYCPERGAAIDPHIDDCWIWGERIPTLSLLIDSTLTMRTFNGPETKYNLVDRKTYPAQVGEDGSVQEIKEMSEEYTKLQEDDVQRSDGCKDTHSTSLTSQPGAGHVVRLPMPRRSLLVLYGAARYAWEHGILREDIPTRRVCITYRELTPTYLPCGPKSEVGEAILQAGKVFWDHRQYYSLDEDHADKATP
ncbi:Alpha-ketoglutarate-dependent dioxygenase alkB 4 [Chionoecetes opilio]|uniref:Alpha-ketoglutarate-dependent dioxygenase alkB 4 n=1 Tax=Chionoecetes opilio TaxID=41210 RepID=A0A8J4YDW0_CHIOP|nr:Alpha-ketoglutarate-dependent dioxygenase alkB 4 [Chionoecetes opilio]